MAESRAHLRAMLATERLSDEEVEATKQWLREYTESFRKAVEL